MIISACYYSFCNVCCDSIQFQLINISQTDIIGELIDIRSNSGSEKIRNIIDLNEIKKCKIACRDNYFVMMPIVLPTPPRDNFLGKNPARSCADILKWGE